MPRAATPISAAMRSGSWIKSRLVPVNFAVANRGMGADIAADRSERVLRVA
jgi:hypothetical protein